MIGQLSKQESVSPRLEDVALDLAEERRDLDLRRTVQEAYEWQGKMVDTFTHRLALQEDEEFRAKAEINRLKEMLNDNKVCPL